MAAKIRIKCPHCGEANNVYSVNDLCPKCGQPLGVEEEGSIIYTVKVLPTALQAASGCI